MRGYAHGGYVPENEDVKYIDFSSSLVPGMPEKVRQAAVSAMENAERYPDPKYRRLKEAIAGKYNTVPENIVCGNGAADLIYRIVSVFRKRAEQTGKNKAWIIEPAFSEYEKALLQYGLDVYHYNTETDDYRVTDRLLSELEKEEACNAGIIFLAQPANPTGILTNEELLERLLAVCVERNVILVLDESFYELTSEGSRLWPGMENNGYRAEMKLKKNLLILNSFTKLYAMAGLRLGFLIGGDEGLIKEIDQTGQPWSISNPAVMAGIAALSLPEEEYRKPLTEAIGRECKRVKDRLKALGLIVWPGEANYLFFRSKIQDLDHRLKEKRIIIRDCSNFYGLTKGFYRIAILGREENDSLITEIECIIQRDLGES
ncbi:MAG: aminotransferase class I/II-fold pyridoxal phosphate-dependent enzyme [Lachnospiraceae bacterium]|nr:aminotransferase class I/II-fold pyridoxal phosphate-dependent enzyme [Lachnospiraceae bacterium]